MKTIVNGQVIEVPMSRDGAVSADTIRMLARIPPSRALVLQQRDGTNLLINPGEHVRVEPAARFIDMPLHKRGH